MISTLIKQYTDTGKIPLGWSGRIGVYYKPFLMSVYPAEMQDLAIKRILPLYKYWAKKNVQTLEEAKSSIPVCKFCNSYPVTPKVVSDGLINECCHQRICLNRYTKQETESGMLEKYGVVNISSLDSIKRLKSEKYLAKSEEEQNEINQKRIGTCNEKYGCDNISQIQEVKEKKIDSFTKHYGQTNIFKRSDLMKEYWQNSLGVSNPKHDPTINEKRVRNSFSGQLQNTEILKISGREYVVSNHAESELLRCVGSFIGWEYITANEYVFQKVVNNETTAYLADISIGDDIHIEVKYGGYIDKQYVDRVLDIVGKNENIVLIFFIIVEHGQLMATFVKGKMYISYHGSKKMLSYENIFRSHNIVETQPCGHSLYTHLINHVTSLVPENWLKQERYRELYLCNLAYIPDQKETSQDTTTIENKQHDDCPPTFDF